MNEQATSEPQETPQTARPRLSGELERMYLEEHEIEWLLDEGEKTGDVLRIQWGNTPYILRTQINEWAFALIAKMRTNAVELRGEPRSGESSD